MDPTPTQETATTPPFRVPPLIKRNITLFALSQTFTGAGMQLAYGFGPLMVLALTGSPGMAGLSVALVAFSRFLIAYTAGRITDRFGRKPGILLGLTLALIGASIIGSALPLNSFVAFVAGMLIFGMGMNASQQLRVAATDMFPPNRRAQALGYVALGSLLGLTVSPILVSVSENYAAGFGIDTLALAWFTLPLIIIPGMFLISFVRPDPKQIGMELEKYYPGYQAPPRKSRGDVKFHPMQLYRNVSTRLAILSNAAAQGNMSIVMVLTSLVLSDRGYSLPEIAMSHMFHSAGMFAFTIPLGRLSDRLGRELVMFPGVATALFGACLVGLTGFLWSVTLGTFLVGLGWAAANVSATAMIADHVEVHERGRAIGVNDTVGGLTSMMVALVTGPLIVAYGLAATGLVAAAIALPPLLMVFMLASKRQAPAKPDAAAAVKEPAE